MRSRVILIVSGILIGTCVYQPEGRAAEAETPDQVLAVFDGGSVTILDIDAKAASNTRLVLRGSRENARRRAEETAGGREALVKDLAFIRILADTAVKHQIVLDGTEEAELRTEEDEILGMIYFSSIVDREIANAREAHERLYQDYYDDHKDEFTIPATWTFQYIQVGKPEALGEAAPGDIEESSAEAGTATIGDEARAQLREKAQEIHRLCRSGSDFTALAQKYSDVEPAKRGRLVGPTTGRRFAPEVASALRKLSPGEISPPVATRHGFLILRCEDYSPEGLIPFAEARPRIEKEVPPFQSEPIIEQVRARLLADHPFKIYPERISIEAERSEELIIEGELVRIYNRDVFTPRTRRIMQDDEVKPKQPLRMAQSRYFTRMMGQVARKEGLSRDPVAVRALQLLREFALARQVMQRLKEGALPPIPAYQPPSQEHREKVLELFHFRFMGEAESEG